MNGSYLALSSLYYYSINLYHIVSHMPKRREYDLTTVLKGSNKNIR
uniref:Uncharacterized protein n=1 Tax=Rhizophora mucronata TaxID=61149 RepID=A0A2P2QEG7_RHIMU